MGSTEQCILKMMLWLLIDHCIIICMKILLFIIDNLDEDSTCSLRVLKIVGFIFYFICFPFLIVWNIIGTIWFIEIENQEGTNCVYIC